MAERTVFVSENKSVVVDTVTGEILRVIGGTLTAVDALTLEQNGQSGLANQVNRRVAGLPFEPTSSPAPSASSTPADEGLTLVPGYEAQVAERDKDRALQKYGIDTQSSDNRKARSTARGIANQQAGSSAADRGLRKHIADQQAAIAREVLAGNMASEEADRALQELLAEADRELTQDLADQQAELTREVAAGIRSSEEADRELEELLAQQQVDFATVQNAADRTLDELLAAEDRALQTSLSELEAELTREVTAAQTASGDADRELREANAQADREHSTTLAELERELRLELQSNTISSNEYLQAQQLGQQEAEFGRNLAFKKNQFVWQQEVDKNNLILEQGKLDLQYLADARQERVLMAQLQANPADAVLWEFYKRGLTGSDVQKFDTTGTPSMPNGIEAPARPNNYPTPSKPFSDESFQRLADDIVNPSDKALYNPNLGGKGVFGISVPNPQDFSRQEYNALDQSSRGLLESLLKAGVETEPGGSRVGIPTEDFHKQVQQSFVPTINSINPIGVTHYK